MLGVRAPTDSDRNARVEAARSRPRSTRSARETTRSSRLVIGEAYGIPTVALRFFNVYGPGQALSNPYTGVAAIFASRLLNGRPPVIFEDGQQSRDFIHVDDIVSGIVLALESDDAVGRTVNLGTGRSVTVNDVAAALAERPGVGAGARAHEQYRAGDIRHCFADPTLAAELLGFRASIALEDGMRELAGWLAGQAAVDRVDAATAGTRRARPSTSAPGSIRNVHDLAIIIVSTNEAHWLPPCLDDGVRARWATCRGRRRRQITRRRTGLESSSKTSFPAPG